MSKKTMQKATFKDLLAKKIQKEQDQFKSKDILVSSIGSYLTFVKPRDTVLINVIDEIGDGKSVGDMVQAFKTLIYHTCPMLQDPEFHKELEIQDPDEVVSAIFDISDIMEIGQELMELVNINTKVDEIKN